MVTEIINLKKKIPRIEFILCQWWLEEENKRLA